MGRKLAVPQKQQRQLRVGQWKSQCGRSEFLSLHSYSKKNCGHKSQTREILEFLLESLVVFSVGSNTKKNGLNVSIAKK